MKKKLLILGILPLLALSSCGRGAKIEEAKAKEIASAIHTYNTKAEGQEDSPSGTDYKGFDMVMSMEGSSGTGENKKSETLKYKLTVNQDDETRFEGKGTDGDEKIDFLLVIAKPEGKTDKVNYLKYYDNEAKEFKELAMPNGTTGNKEYNNYSMQMLVPAFMLAKFLDPQPLMQKEKENEEHEIVINGDYLFDYDSLDEAKDFEENWEFYSKGDKNLTIVASTKYKGQQTEFADETMLETSYEITYDKLIIKNVKCTAKSDLGNVVKMNLHVNAKKDAFKIELPSGWEDKILPSSSTPLNSSEEPSSMA